MRPDLKAPILVAVCILLFCAAPTAFAAPSPCTLLTPAQVNAALGVAAKPDPMGAKGCTWRAGAKSMTVTIEPPKEFAGAKMPQRGVTKAPVTGVGDEAVSAVFGSQASLTVRKGGTVFIVRVYGFPLEQAKAKEKAAAVDVAAKL